MNLPPKEGVGNAGCPLHPQPRVRFALVESARVNEYTGITRRSRTQWFYDLFRALPGDRALLPPSPADMFCLSPVGPTQLRELDTSVGVSGPHDFAVRNNISRPRAVDRSRVFRQPALQSRRAQNAAASTASHPASVTIAIRPSVGRDAKSSRCDLGCVGTEIFFGKSEIRLDTPVNEPPDGQIT